MPVQFLILFAQKIRNSRSLLLALLLLAMHDPFLRAQLLDASSSPPEGAVLRSIVVMGLAPADEAALHRDIPDWIGRPLTQEAIDHIAGRARQAGLPVGRMKTVIRPLGDSPGAPPQPGPRRWVNVELILDFRPPPRIDEIRLFPLIPIEVSRLRAEIKASPGGEFTGDSLDAMVAALRAASAEQGFAEVVVTPQPHFLTSSTLALVLFIEGPAPASLRKTEIKGAGWFNASKIRAQLKKLDKPLNLDKGSSVTASLLIETEAAIAAFMHAQGFIGAKSRLAQTIATPEGLEVRYEIERGPRFRVASTEVRGKKFPDSEFWQSVTEKYEGKRFSLGKMRDLEDDIKARAQAEGYMDPRINLDFAPVQAKSEMAIVASVDEGTTSILGAVKIERTPPDRGYGDSWYHRRFAPPLASDAILRQLRTKMGAPLDRQLLDNASRRLDALGTFETVEIDTAATSISLVRNLVARLKDRRTARLGTSIGWAPEIGPVTRAALTEANVGGVADNAGIALSLDPTGLGGEISYLNRNWDAGERWLGPEREPSLLYSAYLGARDYDEYLERRTGGALQLGYLIGEPDGPWSNSWTARIEKISFEAPGGIDDFEEDFNGYVAQIVAYHLTYDVRRRLKDGRLRGMMIDSAIEAGHADGILLGWTTRLDYTRPLARRWTWLSQSELGLMPFDASDVGLAHRFHAGGETGIRGFTHRGVGPVDSKNDELHIGGATKLVFRNELRLRLNDSFQFPFFFDIGALGEGPLQVGGPRASVGFGIHYQLPDSNRQAFVYLSQNFLTAKTDDEQTIRFGFNVPF